MKTPSQPALHWWRPASHLVVSGPDAGAFLQGQFTNDLRQLAHDQDVYGLWLNVKGKVLADGFVSRGDAEHFQVTSYFSPAAVIRERLESHVIADDVLIEDVTAGFAGVSAVGEASSALAEARRGISSTADSYEAGQWLRGRRGEDEVVEWVFPAPLAEAVRKRLMGCPEVDAAEMERRRIRAGIPAVPVDVGPADLPNEAGLEAAAISYTKGCYLGQEVMARLKSMGQVRRRLLRVAAPIAEYPPLPAPLFAGARNVGELRSAATEADGTMIGLAMLSLLHVRAETKLAFAADGAPVLRLVDPA